jgi:hypothetical protein
VSALTRLPAPDARARNEWAKYAMSRLALAASFREALYCGREAITHGVPADVVFDALEAWVRAVTA